jgi:ADP-ribose pyrophosphatase YjhB (NUDIX family)
MKKVKKDGPTSSSVHVSAPLENKDIIKNKVLTEEIDDTTEKEPPLNNISKDADESGGYSSPLLDIQTIVEGMDWELLHSTKDPDVAQQTAIEQLTADPLFYKKVKAIPEEEWSNDPRSFSVDLGSGHARQDGYLGFDTYPYDHGTIVHDIDQGIPLSNNSVQKIRAVNCLHETEDPREVLKEIQRVLKVGGEFEYQGPEDLYADPDWSEDFPSLVLTNHSDNVEKANDTPLYSQTFTCVATPDASTANSAEPRTGIAQYDMMPADQLLSCDSMGYYWSDAATSGKGNREMGYASQGTPVGKSVKKSFEERVAKISVRCGNLLLMGKRRDNGKWTIPGGHVDMNETFLEGAYRELKEETGLGLPPGSLNYLTGIETVNNNLSVQGFYVNLSKKQATSMGNDPDEEVERWRWIDITNGLPKEIFKNMHVPIERDVVMKKLGLDNLIQKTKIFKSDKFRQIVYGVVLAPDEVDFQDDYMTAQDIEDAAHDYLVRSRIVGKQHSSQAEANVVESYIAPMDMKFDGQNGPQLVKKGSWIMGVKITDETEWEKVLDGSYTGFSVGGEGERV